MSLTDKCALVLLAALCTASIVSSRADDYDSKDHHDDQQDDQTDEHHSYNGDEDSHHPDDPDISAGGEHYKDGGHEDDYDHDSVLGSHQEAEEFKELSPDEAKTRLGVLVNKMDTNSDGKVSQEELKNWIINSFKNLDTENARHKMEEVDINKDNKVTWNEWLQKHYGYSEKEVAEFAKEKNKDMQNFMKNLESQKVKFMMADVNKDQSLDLQEFTAFLHPKNYPHMAAFEVSKTLEDFDKNKDGAINFEEFIDFDKNITKEGKEKEKKHFDEFDVNKDGKLDKTEIQAWSMPGFTKTAEHEVTHLFKETDKNKDGTLTKEEIVVMHEIWVGSHATDYGKHLEDMKKDEL